MKRVAMGAGWGRNMQARATSRPSYVPSPCAVTGPHYGPQAPVGGVVLAVHCCRQPARRRPLCRACGMGEAPETREGERCLCSA